MNNRGLSLVELLVYTGLSMVVLLGGFSLLKLSTGMQTTSSTFSSLQDARNLILEKYKNNASFQQTFNAPQNAAAFGCLKNKTSCAGRGADFTLLDENGARVLFAAAAGSSEGLNRSGAVCSGFNAVSGNDACPFSYRTYWVPRCTGLCMNPVVELRAELRFKSATDLKVPLNVASYDIIFVKKDLRAKLTETCQSIGGSPGPDNTCILGLAGPPCPPHHYIVGFTNQGQKICRHLPGYKCPTGQVLLGVNSVGTAICGPGCANPGSSSGSMW